MTNRYFIIDSLASNGFGPFMKERNSRRMTQKGLNDLMLYPESLQSSEEEELNL